MKTECSSVPAEINGEEQLVFSFADAPKPIVVKVDADHLSTDAGLLAMRQVDEDVGLTEAFLDGLEDRRERRMLVHPLRRLVRETAYAYAAGYEDGNDHTPLRDDPLVKALVGPIARGSVNPKKQDGLASEATLSRLLSGRKVSGFEAAQRSHVQAFLRVLGKAEPSVLTLDIDGFGIETHGQQQLTLFNGYLQQEGYYPLYVTVAEYGFAVGARLRPGNAGAGVEAIELLAPIVAVLQQALPKTQLRLRADAGFAAPEFFQFAERHRLQYFVRLRMNSVLREEFDWLLPEPLPDDPCRRQEWVRDYEYQAKSWPRARRVAMKLVWNEKTSGYERYVLVTNAKKAPKKLWSIYHHRGQHEQRISELVNDLHLKMSCCVMAANSVKLHLCVLAHNLHAAIRMALPKKHPHKRSTVATLIRSIIRCAAQIRISARRILVRLARTTPNTAGLCDILRHLQRPGRRSTPLWSSG